MTVYLKHPMQVGYDGLMATVGENTDEQLTQQVQVIIGTRLGERPMAVGFGVPQLPWAGLHAGDVQAVLDRFGPDIIVTDVTGVPRDMETSDYTVTWARAQQ